MKGTPKSLQKGDVWGLPTHHVFGCLGMVTIILLEGSVFFTEPLNVEGSSS